jgi:hypothetical protein
MRHASLLPCLLAVLNTSFPHVPLYLDLKRLPIFLRPGVAGS